MADTPNLAKGETEVQIDQFNIWLRGTPQYQSLLKSWGQDPGHPHDLSDSQKTQIVRVAQGLGAKVDESNEEVDDNGNFRNQGHKLRNTLIVAGIAAATIATMGAAGVFAGAAGAGAGAGEAAGAAAGLGGVEAGATAGIGEAVASGALAGGAGAGLGGAAAAGGAALGGVEAGATAGLDASVAGGSLAGGAGAGLGGASGAAGAAGGLAPLASSATVPTATGTVAGGTGGVGSSAAGTLAASDGSSLASAGSAAAGGASSLSKLGSLLGGAGSAVGNATTAAGNNALDQEKLGLTANAQNITGQAEFENELMNRSKTEASQRQGSLADIYRQSYSTSDAAGTGPKVGPNNKAGSPVYSPAYLKALSDLESQGATKLSKTATYDTNAMPALTPYTPVNPANVQGATNTSPSTLQKVGNYAAPALTIADAFANYFGS